jgi:hypothetical protein
MTIDKIAGKRVESNRKNKGILLDKAFDAAAEKSAAVSVFGKYNLVLSGDFSMTIKVLRRFSSNRTMGEHTGAASAAALTHGVSGITADELINMYVSNDTDGSFGLITDNDATTITATLAGGTNDAWNPGDKFSLWYVATTLSSESDPQFEEPEENVELMAVVSAYTDGVAKLRISQ